MPSHLVAETNSLVVFAVRAQVWGEEVHVGRYDLLEGDDAKLEGLERVQRATAMTNNVLMDRLFPASFVPSGETAVMDMGSGFGTFARSIATRFGCKVSAGHSLDGARSPQRSYTRPLPTTIRSTPAAPRVIVLLLSKTDSSIIIAVVLTSSCCRVLLLF